jgi:hypothetical protein
MVDIYRSLARVVVTVNIARAGAVPSHTVYDILDTVLVPKRVRQDHVIMSRMVGDAEQVVGAGFRGRRSHSGSRFQDRERPAR